MTFRLLAVLAALLIFPATASAGTLSITNFGAVEFADTDGVRTDLTVARTGDVITFDDVHAITVTDTAVVDCTNRPDNTIVDCTFAAGTGDDKDLTILAGAGDDTVVVSADNDTQIDGSSGVDVLTGGPGADNIDGGNSTAADVATTATFDTLRGNGGADSLDGGEGNDVVLGGGGADILQDSGTGSDEFDQLRYNDDASRPGGVEITVNSGDGNDGADLEGDTVGAGFETFWLSPGSDEITGTDEDETFLGDDGADILHGDGGDDTFESSPGADTFDGGSDVGGGDTVWYPGANPVRVSIDDQANDGENGGAEGDDVRTNVENVKAGEGSDTLIGSTGGGETLDGQNGNDRIEDGGGADTLIGYFGEDVIVARDGAADTVFCGGTFHGSSVSDGSDDTVRVDDSGDTVNCMDRSWGDIVDDKPAPEISNLSAENGQAGTDAVTVLRGAIDANASEVTEWYFEYGPTTAYGSETPVTGVGGDAPQPVNWTIPQVAQGQTLHYRLVAVRGGKGKLVWASGDATFTPGGGGGGTAVPPGVITGAASEITATTARLAGTVDPNGAATDYRFDYGTSSELSKSTLTQPAGSGDTPQAVSANIGDLQPSTKYFFRAVAIRGGIPYAGEEGSFTTAAATAATTTTTTTTPKKEDPKPPAPPASTPPPARPATVLLGGTFATSSTPTPTQQSVPTPDFLPKKANDRWRLSSLQDVHTGLTNSNLNVDFSTRAVGREGIPKALREDAAFMRALNANDVVDQAPNPVKTPFIANAVTTGDKPGFRVTVYDPTKDKSLDRALDQKGCAYERRDEVGEKLREALENVALHTTDKKGAADRLEAQGCTWEFATVKGSTKATTTTVDRSTVVLARRQGLDGGRQPIVGLHVTEPRPAPAPANPVTPDPDAQAGRELNVVLSGGVASANGWQHQLSLSHHGTDGVAFTNARGKSSTGIGQSFTVTALQRVTGQKVPGVKVEVSYISQSDKQKAGGEGAVQETKTTDSEGHAVFQGLDFPYAGTVTIRLTRVDSVRGEDSVYQLLGKRQVPVVTRGCEDWATLDGEVFRAQKVDGKCVDSYQRVAKARAAQTQTWWDAFVGAFKGAVDSIVNAVFRGGRTLDGKDLRGLIDPNKVRACSLDDPNGAGAAGKLPQGGRATSVLIRPDGTETIGDAPVLATSTGDTCVMDRERILTDLAEFASTLQGNDLQIIRNNGGLLTPALVAKVIATGGLNMTPEKAASVIATGGGNLTAAQIRGAMFDAAGIRRSSFDIARVIATGGGNVIATGGGNVIATGGGNVIATGGLNLVAANVAGVIATGGGNLTVQQAAQVIATGGGNLNPNAIVGVIATGGGNFGPRDLASQVIATGGGNIALTTIQSWFTAASVIATGGGNILGKPGEPLMAIASSSAMRGSAGVIATGGGNLIGQAGGNVISVGGGNLIGQAGGN